LPTNIRQGAQETEVTNTLAYCAAEFITAVKFYDTGRAQRERKYFEAFFIFFLFQFSAFVGQTFLSTHSTRDLKCFYSDMNYLWGATPISMMTHSITTISLVKYTVETLNIHHNRTQLKDTWNNETEHSNTVRGEHSALRH
jgi:hypothetical protein